MFDRPSETSQATSEKVENKIETTHKEEATKKNYLYPILGVLGIFY